MENKDGRRSPRASLLITGELRTETGTHYQFKVRNISATGLLGELEATLTTGETVHVTVGDKLQIVATVAWTCAPRFGLQFDHPIDPSSARRRLAYEPRPIPTTHGPIKRRI